MTEPVSDAHAHADASYPIGPVNRVKRLHQRAAYDHATVHAILDAAALAHVAYVVDGQPYCTPTLFWREGTRLYWHGSSASRMLRQQAEGVPVCLTVTHLDSFVLARCGFNHSVDYRSVMAFGRARRVDDADEKQQALVMMVDRLFPHRSAGLRPSTALELKATAVVTMEIEQASAKVRDKGLADEEADHALPIYAERIPVHTVLGTPEPCPRLQAGVRRPLELGPYRSGRRLDEALSEAHAMAYRQK
ncbi:pyridoxamine 5'-phosphate oxidase family protein [Aquabacterium sp.]|uniref:pyridoxamine 5'-phosphate oxidase family protein n=1 Tax=Aquabacterium sp. TaxID=1872578 RepID=UPI0037840A15